MGHRASQHDIDALYVEMREKEAKQERRKEDLKIFLAEAVFVVGLLLTWWYVG